MAHTVDIPLLGKSVVEPRIVAWHKQIGDQVAKGDCLFELEVEGALFEVDSEHEGILLDILVPIGTRVQAGTSACAVGTYDEARPNLQCSDRPDGAAALDGDSSGNRRGTGKGNSGPFPQDSGDNLVERMIRVWEETLGVKHIRPTDSFLGLGGDSLLAAHLMVLVDKEFGRKLPLTAVLEAPTVSELAALAGGDGTASFPPKILVALRPGGTRPPFYCVPGLVGTVFCFAPMLKYLGPDQPLYAFQAQGVYDEAEPLSTVEEMADLFLAELRKAQPKGPYHLGGHSSGGLVAYHMALELQRQGEEVARVVLLDTYAIPAGQPTEYLDALINAAESAFWTALLLVLLGNFFGRKYDLDFAEFSGLKEEERSARLSHALCELGVVSPESSLNLIRGCVKVMRATALAVLRYTAPRSKLPLMVIACKEHPKGAKRMWLACVRALKQVLFASPGLTIRGFPKLVRTLWLARRQADNPAQAWRLLSTTRVVDRWVGGNHVTMLVEPHVRGLATAIRESVDEGMQRSGAPDAGDAVPSSAAQPAAAAKRE